MSHSTEVDYSGEGRLDASLARRLILVAGLTPGRDLTLGRLKSGKAALDESMRGLNASARHRPVLVLRDLDDDAPCGGALVAKLEARAMLRSRTPALLLRIAVRSADAWLLADREGLANALGVSPVRIPSFPESLDRPKHRLQALFAHVPLSIRRQLGLPRGPKQLPWPPVAGWLARDFVPEIWEPRRAAGNAPSLARCLACLTDLTTA